MIDELESAIAVANARRHLPPPRVRRARRELAGISQPALARVLGVTPSALSRWESGERTPRGATLLRYIDALARLARESLSS